jgi:hypothetical protein
VKRVTRTAGNAFTQKELETTEYDERELDECFDEINELRKDPWASRRENVKWAEAMLTEEGRKPKHSWKPYEDVEWYLWKLVCHGSAAQDHIDRGEAALAAHNACLFGEVWRELHLKLMREELYLKGAKIIEERANGARLVRKCSADERVQAVEQALASGRLKSMRSACQHAARNKPGCGSWQAFERDYREHKKVPHPSD